MSTTTLQSLLHSDRNLGSEWSSISSDTVHTVTDNHYYPRPQSEASIIHAITQTMIGEFMYKYTRRMFYKGHGEKRHKRFFWLHPYTRTLYWSDADPGSSNVSESSAKSAYIEGVRYVLDPNPLPPGLHGYSIVVSTPTTEIKFTAPSKDRHDIWINAIQYLLIRPDTSTPSSTKNAPNGPGPASFGTITRDRDIDDSTQQSTDRGGAGDFCTPLRENEATEPGPEDYSVIRGRDPISANDPHVVASNGRGAGNISSPSLSRDDIRGSSETQSESERAAHPQMLQCRALHFPGIGNPECSEVSHHEGAENPYDLNPHLTHSHDAESFGHGGSGNISHDLSREPEAEDTHNPLSRFLHGLGGGGNGEVKY